jgi:hypothetical protein
MVQNHETARAVGPSDSAAAAEARCDDAAAATATPLHVFRSKESHDIIPTLFQDTLTFPPVISSI